MADVRAILLLVHLVAMLFMAAPLYGLIIVGERARFNVPPGYNTDRYMENIIKGTPMRCYAYLTVIFISGLLLLWSRGWVWNEWALIAKLAVFALIVTFLSYVHFTIQPRIEKLLEGLKAGEELPARDKPALLALRGRRKKFTATCLFLVLTALFLGIKMTWGYSPWLLAVFMAGAVLFAYRAYRKPVPSGWF